MVRSIADHTEHVPEFVGLLAGSGVAGGAVCAALCPAAGGLTLLNLAEAGGGIAAEDAIAHPEHAAQVFSAAENVITGFTEHAANQAITRGFSTPQILDIVRNGTAVDQMGRYGPQVLYTLGNNTVVVNAAGKVVTVFSNASGTANGLGRGDFIP